MYFILLNGPKQSGKTTLADKIATSLSTSLPARQVLTLHLKAPIELALRAIVSAYYPETANMEYEELKKFSLGAMTGRDLMIELGESFHARDAQFLPRMLFKAAKLSADGREQIIIVDDLGRETEYAAFVHNPDGTGIMNIYLEKRGDNLYGHGQRFVGDNRMSLRGYADFIDPDVDTVVNAVIGKLGE